MILLTGDVHHMSLKTKDQQYMPCTEMEAAVRYARIARQNGLKVTLFITGKSAIEEPTLLRVLANMENVCLGGHNFYAFHPKWLYKILNHLFCTKNGPSFLQEWEIRKTKDVFYSLCGVRIDSWRDHGYRQDKNTYRLLLRNKITYISDDVGPEFSGPYEVQPGQFSIPINVLPDHDHLVHGSFTTTIQKNNPKRRSLFDKGLYSAKEWLELVKTQVTEIVRQGNVATLLVHPACMMILDDFFTFMKLCKFLQDFESEFIDTSVTKYVQIRRQAYLRKYIIRND